MIVSRYTTRTDFQIKSLRARRAEACLNEPHRSRSCENNVRIKVRPPRRSMPT